MLFTLTTLKSLASGVCCSEEQNVGTESLFFLHKNDAQSVADGGRRRIKISLYVSVIFVDPGVPIDEM